MWGLRDSSKCAMRGLRDSSKCARLLGELKNLGVDVAVVQGTHFTCGADCRVLESDFNVLIRQRHQRWGLLASWTLP